MKLSVIIPVYNVSGTLDRCLKSVAGQTMRDMQIILVDDASTDDSADICRQWANDDGRIQVVQHKVNQGLSAARNSGIEKAKGEKSDCRKEVRDALLDVVEVYAFADKDYIACMKKYGFYEESFKRMMNRWSNEQKKWFEGVGGANG